MFNNSSDILKNNRKFEAQIWHYIDHKLNTRREEFDNLPICPYAKKYRDSIQVRVSENNLYDTLSWALKYWEPENTAWVFGLRLENAPNPTIAENVCDGFAHNFSKQNATVLLDHPSNSQTVGGVNTAFGKGVLVVIQNTLLLDRHRNELLKTNYYAKWSDDDKRELC